MLRKDMPKLPARRGPKIEDTEFRLPEGYVIARRIDLRQLWYAVVATEHRSMRRADYLLRVRQPTLSRSCSSWNGRLDTRAET
jgi:hypothetical protein